MVADKVVLVQLKVIILEVAMVLWSVMMERFQRDVLNDEMAGNLMKNFYKKINSQVGVLHLVSDTEKLKALVFDINWEEYVKKMDFELVQKNNEINRQTEIQLNEYFEAKRKYFEIPFKFEGTTFQKRVWQGLLKIPYGKTISYSEQAKLINQPNAVRAVGGANGKNNICIIVPCHRVIGKNGSLTGFGGGIKIKERLLQLEKTIV